jgi:hypothetical protein
MYNRILAAVRFFKTAMRRADRVRRWRLSAFLKTQSTRQTAVGALRPHK